MISNPSSEIEWRALLSRAEVLTGCALGEHLETYLLRLLVRVATSPHRLEGLLALDGLTEQPEGKSRIEHLQDIGDQCLLYAGLFPETAEQRGVRLGYFVSLGRTAYQQLHELVPDDQCWLYGHLCAVFPSVIELLHAMSELSDDCGGLTPLHAFDLWSNTGSPRALRYILACTDGIPVQPALDETARLM